MLAACLVSGCWDTRGMNGEEGRETEDRLLLAWPGSGSSVRTELHDASGVWFCFTSELASNTSIFTETSSKRASRAQRRVPALRRKAPDGLL